MWRSRGFRGSRFDSIEGLQGACPDADPEGNLLPDDTIASVKTRELIGDVYIGLSPGAWTDDPPGGGIRDTEAPVDLEGLIGQFVHGNTK